MLPKYIVGITRQGRRDGTTRDVGPRVAEAAALRRESGVYRLPTLVSLVYTATARGKRSERASRRKVRDARRAREGRTMVCPGYGCVMACVVVEGETGLLGQQYVPEARAHRTEDAHVCTRKGMYAVYYI